MFCNFQRFGVIQYLRGQKEVGRCSVHVCSLEQRVGYVKCPQLTTGGLLGDQNWVKYGLRSC